MVAYSFKAMFAEPIRAGVKRQTVRAERRRHARAGEQLQLYQGMRTRSCSKIIPDPICTAVLPITIQIALHPDFIASIEIGGAPLSDEEIVAFAVQDGFGEVSGDPRYKMGRFWFDTHGLGEFHGWIIRW